MKGSFVMWSLEERNLIYRYGLEREARHYRLEKQAEAARRDREAAERPAPQPRPSVWLRFLLAARRLMPTIERKNSMETC